LTVYDAEMANATDFVWFSRTAVRHYLSRRVVHFLQPKRYDHDAQLAQLASVEIDVVVFSMLPHITFGACGGEASSWATRCFNEGLAEVQQQFPGRIYGMGMVPLPYGRAAAAELERASHELGIRTVQILSNNCGRTLDDPEFLPFFERAEELQTLVSVHPYVRAFHYFHDYYLPNLIGNPVETTGAIACLIFSGVLERFPRLKLFVCPRRWGGAVSYWPLASRPCSPRGSAREV
jgi:aminocarboxymuconate-semialdehyde decarboxylase